MKTITETDKDNALEAGAVVVVWLPRWYFGCAIVYSLLMVWLPHAVVYGMVIRNLLTADLPPALRRYCYLSLAIWPILIFLGVQLQRQRWRVLWKPSVSIFPNRVVVRGKELPWDSIGCCRWSVYSRRTLVIQVARDGAYGRMSVPIPDDRSVVIEQIFRAFGKWDQAVRNDAVGQESGMGIKLGV
jgi:hypothetical protein